MSHWRKPRETRDGENWLPLTEDEYLDLAENTGPPIDTAWYWCAVLGAGAAGALIIGGLAELLS